VIEAHRKEMGGGHGETAKGSAATRAAANATGRVTSDPDQSKRHNSPVLSASIDALKQSIDELKKEVASLTNQLEAVTAQLTAKPREISDEAAKTEIKQYFESLDGDVIYPSDVADDLNIDYDTVARLIQELVADGQIAAA
jgi:hypothetical protein